MIHFIVYFAAAGKFVGEEEMMDFFLVQQVHNNSKGITGLMVLVNNDVFHCIEGMSKELVQEYYDEMLKDGHFSGTIKLVAGKTANRQFDSWTMAYYSGTTEEKSKVQGFEFLTKEFLEKFDFISAHPSIALFSSFLQNQPLAWKLTMGYN